MTSKAYTLARPFVRLYSLSKWEGRLCKGWEGNLRHAPCVCLGKKKASLEVTNIVTPLKILSFLVLELRKKL